MAITPKVTPPADVKPPEAVRPEPDTKDEYDGQGNRVHAVRHGEVDAELVQNGLTQYPDVHREVKTDEHTGRFIAETTIMAEKPIAEGDVVEGLSDEELHPLVSSGAVRRETKDEARDSK